MNFLFVAITLKFKNGLGFFVWINKECEYYYNYFIRIYSLYNIAKICLKVQIHCTFIYVFRFICILIYIFIPKLKVLWIHCILLLYKSTYMAKKSLTLQVNRVPTCRYFILSMQWIPKIFPCYKSNTFKNKNAIKYI